MEAILVFILNHCLFVLKKYGFRFVDSDYSEEVFGDAYVTIQSETMKMRFVWDRSQLLLEFSTNREKPGWYSIDLISQLLTGKIEDSSLLDEHYAQFLKENFDAILALFSEENLDSTIKGLKKLARERSKRMFG